MWNGVVVWTGLATATTIPRTQTQDAISTAYYLPPSHLQNTRWRGIQKTVGDGFIYCGVAGALRNIFSFFLLFHFLLTNTKMHSNRVAGSSLPTHTHRCPSALQMSTRGSQSTLLPSKQSGGDFNVHHHPYPLFKWVWGVLTAHPPPTLNDISKTAKSMYWGKSPCIILHVVKYPLVFYYS